MRSLSFSSSCLHRDRSPPCQACPHNIPAAGDSQLLRSVFEPTSAAELFPWTCSSVRGACRGASSAPCACPDALSAIGVADRALGWSRGGGAEGGGASAACDHIIPPSDHAMPCKEVEEEEEEKQGERARAREREMRKRFVSFSVKNGTKEGSAMR